MMNRVQLRSEDWLNLTKSVRFTVRLWLFLLLRIRRTLQWQILKLAHFETQTLRDWRKHSKSRIANCLQAGRRLISCISHKQCALWEGAKLVDAHMHYAWLIWELLFPRQFKTGLSDRDKKSFLALSFSLQTKINRTRCYSSSAIYLRDLLLIWQRNTNRVCSVTAQVDRSWINKLVWTLSGCLLSNYEYTEYF